jgi:hypothetical protein
MGSAGEDVLTRVVAGTILAVVGAPLVFAFWRGRDAGMIKAVPRTTWRSGTFAGCVIAAGLVAVIIFAVLPTNHAAALGGSVVIALATAVALSAAVVRAARRSERRAQRHR